MRAERKPSEEITRQFDEVQALIAGGMAAGPAMEQVGLSRGAYYSRLNRSRKEARKVSQGPRKPRKARELLKVTDLPEMAASAARKGLFLVFGDPAMLADFARTLN